MLLKNHPRGLLVLFFTEMWERFGFYTMNAIYVLYMQKKLGWSDAVTHNFWGFFIGAVYTVPIIGGWLGDQVVGRKATIRLGALLMVAGYIALALSSRDWVMPFYVGLALVAVGTGFFKANISVLVGQLYPEGSPLKDSAFNIFYMGVNLGATFSPLAATWIHNQFDSYNLSFAAAAAGMVVSMVIFQWGGRYLVSAQPGASTGAVSRPAHEKTAPWRAEDWQRIVTLAVLFLIAIFFWVGFYQNGDVLTLFAERSTRAYRFLKAETYQFFGPFFILVLTPPLVWLFSKMRAHGGEPSSASKIASGLFISGLSLLVMVAAGMLGGDHDQAIMSPGWLVSSYFLMSLGEILFSPMGLSFVSKVAPLKIRGLMMGFWFSATAAGGLSSGMLGRLYSSSLPHHLYFLLIAALLLVGAALALVSRRRLDRFTA
jgi:POT family proton-dependent oligopeptide transporter